MTPEWTPQHVRLMPCEACGIDTNHRLAPILRVWVCWCGCEIPAEIDLLPNDTQPVME